MADFDLIPNDYKYWLWQRICFKRFAMILLTSIVSLAALSFYWHTKAQQLLTVTADLQRQLAITQIQQDQLEELVERKYDLQDQWKLLTDLRGGTTVEAILEVIDQALVDDDVWFMDWQFRRPNQVLTLQVAENNFSTENIDSEINTQISIRGQAKDHSAFSGFVQNLIIQNAVVDVKIVRTTLNRLNSINIVEFDILILINNNLEVEHA